ncbi:MULTISPECIES: lipase family protein [Pseudoalteromonas]|nr:MULTISPECIES: hypothetical protein [Pseudoalteromonas]KJY87992.1 hypothetical protein TW75_13770 [Pseudoalteromonas piscicida]
MSNQPTDIEKLVFAVEIFANAGSKNPGASDESLYHTISNSLKEIPFINVDIVWGPHAQMMPNGEAFNTMYVARVSGTDQYIVAIAGTNGKSLFDWIFQDFNVAITTPWIFAPNVKGAEISAATALGLAMLNVMIPQGNVPGSGIPLMHFLRDTAKSPCGITVAGHSKGGALAPTVALMLRDLQGKALLWDPACNATVKTMGTAGPTAGNDVFAAHSNQQLPNGSLSDDKAVSVRFANSLDIVPHAWAESSLEEIKTIYGSEISSRIVDGLIDFAKELANRTNYTQLAPSDPPFAGQLNTSIISSENSDFVNFLQQAAYQHVNSYLEYFQIPISAQQAGLQHLLSEPAIGEQLKQTIESMGERVHGKLEVEATSSTLPLLGDVSTAEGQQKAIKTLIAEMDKLQQPME